MNSNDFPLRNHNLRRKNMTKLIRNLIGHFRYWPHARKYHGQLGALTIIGTSPGSLQRGIATAETGINVRRFTCRYFGEVNDRLPGITGETNFRAVSSKFSRDITAEGEVKGVTGLMAVTMGGTVSFANDTTTFDATTPGRIICDEATETQERDGWRSANVRASSNPLLI